MDAKELVGQLVIRTKPTSNGDYSYCGGRGVRILAATDTNVIIDNGDGKPWALNERFTKDWTPMYEIAKGDKQ